MDSNSMKTLFLEVLARAKKKFPFAVEHFCIMGNHFHLIIRPGNNANLSRIMQWVMSVFAMAWNRVHGLSGHVWGERFFSRVLEGLYSYLQAFHYISENPVKAGLVSSAELWIFGGLWHRKSGNHSIVDLGPPLQ